MSNEPLKKRYIAKLSANLIGVAIGVVTQAIIPRGLGPKAYGDFNFLSNFFTQLMPFFSLSTSTCFYTRLSQRQKDTGLISFYFQFTGFSFIALFIFVVVSHTTGLSDILWVNQSIKYVYMSAGWALLIWVTTLLTQVADAYGLTISSEVAKIVQKLIGMGVVLSLFFFNQLNLTNFFYYHYGILLLLITLFVWIIRQNRIHFFHNWRLKKGQVKLYVKEFYEYSNPLFFYGLISMIIGILDRWLLQNFAGSVEQGFFGLSYQVGTICFVFTSALTSLIIREFSISYSNNNLKEMTRLFRRYIPALYSISAFFGCFACVQAPIIAYIFGGDKFAGAAFPVAIMALYPIHQTYGQLSGAVFYASGRTKQLRNISIALFPLGFLASYLLLAPKGMFGFSAGATGLAVKFVILQFIGVNIQLFYNLKMLNLQFVKYFGHQVFGLFFFLTIALIAKYSINVIEILQNKILYNFIISGILYSFIVGVFTYFQPVIFGLRQDDVRNLIKIFFRITKKP